VFGLRLPVQSNRCFRMALIVSILLVLHGYVALRLAPDLSAWPIFQAGLCALLTLSAVAIPGALLLLRRRGESLTAGSRQLKAAGFLMVGLASSLLVLTLMRDAALVSIHVAGWLIPDALAQAWPAVLPGVGRLRELSALAVPVLALAAALAGWLGARRTAAVRRVDIPIAGLPAALEGFAIVQLSDIHVGNTIGRDYVEAIVRRANSLQPDVVAITGDLVDGTVARLAHDVAPLADLRSRYGTFFVTGNHEYYSGAGPWLVEFQRLGFQVLLNRHVVIEQGGAKLAIAGVTDYSGHHFSEAHRSDPAAAIRGAPDDIAAKILLAHQPRSSAAAADAGFDLQLSGHTHGGQFLPWNFFVRLQQPYTAGLARLRSMWVYTSRGTGYWGPPMRLGAPSEITHIRLVREG
jgi:predicted MPP superfamily phosphohydrolase